MDTQKVLITFLRLISLIERHLELQVFWKINILFSKLRSKNYIYVACVMIPTYVSLFLQVHIYNHANFENHFHNVLIVSIISFHNFQLKSSLWFSLKMCWFESYGRPTHVRFSLPPAIKKKQKEEGRRL